MAGRDKVPAPHNTHRRVQQDERGRSVWVDPVETAEFELVSTQALKSLLASRQADAREAIEHAASTGTHGYLARDAATGHFQIINDETLQVILDQQATEAGRRPPAADVPAPDMAADDLSIVSTQALRKILGTPERTTPDSADAFSEDEAGGFNPYNHR